MHPNSLKNIEEGRKKRDEVYKGFDSKTASEAGKRSGEVRRERAKVRNTLRQSLEILLTKALKSGTLVKAEDIQDMADAEELNVDVQTAMAIAVLQRALMGDVNALTFVRDTIGEKPSDKVEIDQSLTIEAWAKSHKPKL